MDNNFLRFSTLKKQTLDFVYKASNYIYPEHFSGDVLYVGMGTCYLMKEQSSEVTSTSIIEFDPEVIEFNVDNIQEDWQIIQEDAYTFETENKYDIIVLDIWYRPPPKEEIFSLVDKYNNFLKQDGKILYLKNLIRD
jgi:predicted RNA methylase